MSESPLSATEVERLHANSDLDVGALSQHHTLGPKAAQAAPGNHKHLSNDTVTGTTDHTVLKSLLAILVNEMGLKDGTSF